MISIRRLTELLKSRGRSYPEGISIPLDDRETLAATDDFTPQEAEALCDDHEADIASGKYPADSRVTVMGQPVFKGFDS